MTTLLTSREVQELINVDRSTVYRMAEDGRLPGVKVGRQWRFRADEVRAQFGLGTDDPDTRQAPRRPAATSTAAQAPPPTAGPAGLAHLVRPDVLQSVADLIGDVFAVMAVITDLHGHPLTQVSNPCGYYAAIANQPGAAESCLSEWRQFAAEPHVAPRFVRTHLGFLCARTFVWVDLAPVGMIVVGGVTPAVWPPAAEQRAAIADEFGITLDALDAAIHETWDRDAAEQRRIVQLLAQFGDLVSQLASAGRPSFESPERKHTP